MEPAAGALSGWKCDPLLFFVVQGVANTWELPLGDGDTSCEAKSVIL